MKHDTLVKGSISVIIPLYNYAISIERAIRSVIHQVHPTDELIVINDGSTDNSNEVVSSLLNAGLTFKYIMQKNAGLAAVRNRGIRESQGEFLIFLDADDEMAEDALSALRAGFQQHPESQLLIGSHISIKADGSTKAHSAKPLADDKEGRFRDYISRRFGISNGACAMHRSIFNTLQYPEEFRSSEDTAIFALTLALFESAIISAPLAKIYKHDDSMRHNLTSARAVGTQVTNVLFEHPALPQSLKKYRSHFHARRCLSLFRTFASGGAKADAWRYYREALRHDLRLAISSKYLKRLVKMYLAR